MSTDEKDLVLHIAGRAIIQQVNLICKSLPLALSATKIKCCVSLISPVDQSEVGSNLTEYCQYEMQFSGLAVLGLAPYKIECRLVGRSRILFEIPRHTSVFNICVEGLLLQVHSLSCCPADSKGSSDN